MNLRTCVGLIVLSSVVFGCGGNGGSGSSTAVKVSVPVQWAERTRDLSAPASANSVTITLVAASSGREDVILRSDRGDGAAARTTTATSTTSAVPGRYAMRVSYHTGVSGSGSVVAGALTVIQVGANGQVQNEDGSPLTGVTNVSTIGTVTVAADQSFPVFSDFDPAVEVKSTDGSVIALPAGAITLSTESAPPAAISVVAGRLRGVAVGAANVTAVVDGKASAPVAVKVVRQKGTVRTTSAAPMDLEYSVANSRAYGLSNKDLIAYDLNAGTSTLVVTLPAAGQALKVDAAGDRAAVLLAPGNQVAFVNLRSSAITSTVNLTNPSVDLALSPVDSTMFAVSELTGVALYREGIRLGTQPELESYAPGPLEFNADGTALYIVSLGEVRRMAVSTTGLSDYRTAGLAGTNLVGVRGNRVYTASTAFDAMTLATAGSYAVEGPVRSIAVSPAGDRLFVVLGSVSGAPNEAGRVRVIRTSDLAPIAEYDVPINVPSDVASFGVSSNQVAIRVPQSTFGTFGTHLITLP